MKPGRRPLTVIVFGLATAAAFEAMTVLETQDKAIRAVSPWQDDPYDAMVSLAQVTVPMLALAIGLRLLAWRAPGAPERGQQMMRAVGAMMALVGLTAAFEWAAVAAGAHAPARTAWTGFLIGTLAVVSILTASVAVLLARYRSPEGSRGAWTHDWLGDVFLPAARVPGLRRAATPAVATWVRRRAMTVFVALSALAAAVIIGGLAIGEGWRDPLLIGWAFLVETTANLAFCLLSNAVAGFIARPRRHPAEMPVVAGCIAIQIATAFRDPIWSLFTARRLDSVPLLITLTFGAGLIVAAAVAVARAIRRRPVRASALGVRR